jgi:uncharacterized protein (TIGR02231 family)
MSIQPTMPDGYVPVVALPGDGLLAMLTNGMLCSYIHTKDDSKKVRAYCESRPVLAILENSSSVTPAPAPMGVPRFQLKVNMKISVAVLGILPTLAWAQNSRIEQVVVYPGGATVQRVVSVKAGAQQVRLSCLLASFDADSLQVRGEAVTVGEITVQTVTRADAPECSTSPLDTRIRELEDQLAAVNAEITANDVALSYLKGFGSGDNRGSVPVSAPAATAEALRRAALDSLQRQAPLNRRKDDIERALNPLKLERERQQTSAQVRTVLIRLAAKGEGELRINYQINRAGWEPTYRAYLDSSTGQVRLERRAQVAQTTGEDWTGVKLRLSTTQPQRATEMRPPAPWKLDLRPPQSEPPASARMAAPPPPSAPSSMLRQRSSETEEEEVNFDVSVFQGEFATEFEVPGSVSVTSSAQRISFALGTLTLDAKLAARTQPRIDAVAYLVAEVARPTGVWPAGALQVFRDGAFVGQGRLEFGNKEWLDLFFGRDDLLRVSVDPERRDTGSAGFSSRREERKYGRVYRIENRHQRRFAVQVIEASPVGRHEDISVTSRFDPKVSEENWRRQPGVVAWFFTLEPGQTQKIEADYLISFPKEARIEGLR